MAINKYKINDNLCDAREYLIGLYGQDISSFLIDKCNEMIKHTNIACIDNWRFAEVGVKGEEEMFERLRSNGCCGIQEWNVKWKKSTGRKFRIGCNHGH